MLNTSSPAQRLGDEDSSGSDPEPETDRFGFILTNGSTAGCVGPSPELVRQREAKWINIISQWNRILLKKTNKVKVQCQKGIPASLRAKCWPLLCGATDKMKLNQTLYESLDSQAALQSWVDVIERDLDRQFPFHEMFLSKDGHGQRGLFRVLKAYTQYQPEEGYCQAQGPVAAVLLMNMPAEEAFWCLVQISEQYLPGYYSPLLEGVLFDAAMLTWVLKRTCPAAHKHLQQHGVEPLMFATDWLMCLFTRHLPFNTLLRVWDLFFCFGVRVLLQVAVVLVRRVLGRAEQRRQCEGQMETLEMLRGVREQVQEEDDTFIAEVCAVPLSVKDVEKQTEKQLEKWRKDRPSSTFDPRNRCHGYRMAWTRARHAEEEQEKREREKGNLAVPLTRSASTLSLSPSLLQRWRKGGKANTGEWEGGGKVVRHLSVGAREDWRSWTELQFKKVKEVQEEEDAVFDERKHKEINPTAPKEQLKEPKNINKTQNLQTEDAVIVEEQPDTRINTEEEHQQEGNKESRALCKEAEEAEEAEQDKQTVEVNCSGQSQALPLQSHDSMEQEPEAKPENKEMAGSEQPAAVEENQPKDADADSKQESEPEGGTGSCEEQMCQADVKPEESTETKNGQQTMQGLIETTNATLQYPVIETETHQETQEPDKDTQGHELEEKQLCNESLAEVERSEICAEMEEDMLALNSSELEIVEGKVTEHVDSEREAVAVSLCSLECVEQKEDLESEQEVTPRNDAEIDGSNTSSETECSTRAQSDDKEIDLELNIDNDQTQAEEVPTQSQTNEETTDTLVVATNAEQVNPRVDADEGIVEGEPTTEEANIHVQIQEQDKDAQGHELEEKQLSNESLAAVERSGIHAEIEKDMLALNSSELENMERKVSEHLDSESETVTIILCSRECVEPKEGSEVESEQETAPQNDAVMEESNTSSETECSTKAPSGDTEIIVTADFELKLDNDQTQAEEVPTQSQTNEETNDVLQMATSSEQVNLKVDADESKVEGEATAKEANIRLMTQQQVQEQDKGSQEDELDKNHLCNKSLVEAENSGICAEMEKDMQALNSSEQEVVERKVTEDVDSENEAVAIILCSPECVQPKEGSELESEQETRRRNDPVMEESNTRSETECSTWAPQEEKENTSTADLEIKIDDDQTQAEDVQSQTNEETNDILGAATNSEQVNPRADANESTVEGEPTTTEANTCLTLEEESRKNNGEEAAEGDDSVFEGSTKTDSNLQNHDKDAQSDQTQVVGRRNSKSSGDVCLRKSSASRRSWLGRRLSEDLFTMPQKTSQSTANSEAGNPTQSQEVALSQQGGEKSTDVHQEQQLPSPSKRFGLLHRFKREPNKAKVKMQVPKILIQDFSDGTGTGRVVEEEGQEKLSSRERRRRRREQERKEKEEERLRKKKEKEKVKEKERERKKPQTRGKSFQVQREKESTDEAQSAKSEAQTRRCSASYAESYF